MILNFKMFGIGIFFVCCGFGVAIATQVGVELVGAGGGAVAQGSSRNSSDYIAHCIREVPRVDTAFPPSSRNFFLEMYHIHCERSQDFSRLEYLVDRDPRVIYIRNDRGWSPLHMAVFLENYELCKWLVNKGFLVDCTTLCSQATPLMMACDRKNYKLINFFLKAGASVFYSTYQLITIFMLLCKLGDYTAINLIFKHLGRLSDGEIIDAWELNGIKSALFFQCDCEGKTVFDYAKAYADQHGDPKFLECIGLRLKACGSIDMKDPWL